MKVPFESVCLLSRRVNEASAEGVRFNTKVVGRVAFRVSKNGEPIPFSLAERFRRSEDRGCQEAETPVLGMFLEKKHGQIVVPHLIISTKIGEIGIAATQEHIDEAHAFVTKHFGAEATEQAPQTPRIIASAAGGLAVARTSFIPAHSSSI